MLNDCETGENGMNKYCAVASFNSGLATYQQ